MARRGQRIKGFYMPGEAPAIEHRIKPQNERPHIAQEVRMHTGRGHGWGPRDAEEHVHHLKPWAAASALGVPPHFRKPERGPMVLARDTSPVEDMPMPVEV